MGNIRDYKFPSTSPDIYHILSIQNGNFYAGSAKNLRKRIGAHYKGEKSNPYLQNAINNYGIDSFTVRVEIYDTLSYEELLAVEQEYLDKYFEECWDRTYNMSNKAGGGDTITCLSEERQIEFRQKLSEAKCRRKIQKGVRVITEKFCCYCPKDAQGELKIGHVTFHKLFKINEYMGCYYHGY